MNRSPSRRFTINVKPYFPQVCKRTDRQFLSHVRVTEEPTYVTINFVGCFMQLDKTRAWFMHLIRSKSNFILLSFSILNVSITFIKEHKKCGRANVVEKDGCPILQNVPLT